MNKLDGTTAKLNELAELMAQKDVLAKGETVRGEHLMAVYSETTRWDSKMLIGISKVIPQVAEASRVDKNVTVRRC